MKLPGKVVYVPESHLRLSGKLSGCFYEDIDEYFEEHSKEAAGVFILVQQEELVNFIQELKRENI